MLGPGCSGEGTGEAEILPLGILLGSFTLEIDLVGMTVAGVDPRKQSQVHGNAGSFSGRIVGHLYT